MSADKNTPGESVPIKRTDSLVSQLVNKVLPTDEIEIERSIHQIREKCEEANHELSHLIEKYYDEFDYTFDMSILLDKKAFELTEKFEEISHKFNNEAHARILKLNNKKEATTKELNELKNIIEIVEKLQKFQSIFDRSKLAHLSQLFAESIESFMEAGNILEEVEHAAQSSELILSVKKEYFLHCNQVKDDLKCVWFEMVKVSGPEFINNWRDAILVNVILTPTHSIHFLITIWQLLDNLDMLSKLIIEFCKLFHQMVIIPLFKIRTLSVNITMTLEAGDQYTLVHKENFDNSLQISQFLTNIFCRILEFVVGIDGAASKIGKIIWIMLYSSIVEFFDDLNEFANIQQLKENFMEFEKNLIKMKFIDSNETTLASLFESNTHDLSGKYILKILGEAREIVKKDLSNTKIVCIKAEKGRLVDETVFEKEIRDLQSKIYLSTGPLNVSQYSYFRESVFLFPACAVSLFVVELVEKCHILMNECSILPQQQAFRMIKTVRNMIQFFISLVPHINHKQIKSIPRSCIIFYNNCMYLSHHLLTLGIEYRHNMPAPLNTSMCTFIDFVPVLRDLGENAFMDMIDCQKGEVEGILTPLENSIYSIDTTAKATQVEKCFIILISHLQQVKHVLFECSPQYVLRGTTGILLNKASEICIHSVLNLSDISAKDASRAAYLFTILRDKSLTVFDLKADDDPMEILSDCCENWNKFIEIIILLESNLKEIVDRWGDGKGTLAQTFKADEVKNFIKASFKKSDIRAKILSNIS